MPTKYYRCTAVAVRCQTNPNNLKQSTHFSSVMSHVLSHWCPPSSMLSFCVCHRCVGAMGGVGPVCTFSLAGLQNCQVSKLCMAIPVIPEGFPHVSTTATSLWTGLTFQIFPFRWLLASLFHVWPTCKLGIKVDENPSFLSESCFRDPRPSLHNDYITFMIIYNASKYCPKPRISHELSDLAVTYIYIYLYINMYNYIYSI